MLRQHLDELPGKAQRTLGPGLLYGADEIDPYVKIETFDPQWDDMHPAGPRARADCRMCRSGEEHWHRKDNNKPV